MSEIVEKLETVSLLINSIYKDISKYKENIELFKSGVDIDHINDHIMHINSKLLILMNLSNKLYFIIFQKAIYDLYIKNNISL